MTLGFFCTTLEDIVIFKKRITMFNMSGLKQFIYLIVMYKAPYQSQNQFQIAGMYF